MDINEIQSFLTSCRNESNIIYPFGCLIGYLTPETFLPDAGYFATFMCEVFERNLFSVDIGELEIKVPGYSTAASLFLIQKEKILYEVIDELGYKPLQFSKGDEFYAQTSVILKPPDVPTPRVSQESGEEYDMIVKILSGVIKNALRRESFVHIGTSFGWDFESSVDELDYLDSNGKSEIVFAGRTVRCRDPWPKGGGW